MNLAYFQAVAKAGTGSGGGGTPGFLRHYSLFDGVNDYIEVPHTSALSVTGSMTIECWIYLLAYPSNYTALFSKFSSDTVNEFNVRLRTSALSQFYFGGGGAANVCSFDLAANVPLNTWKHLAFVKNEVTKTSNVYVDAVSIATATFSTGTATGTTNPLHIGKQSNSSIVCPNMRLDDVRLWNKAMTQAEVAAAMATGYEAGATNLVGNWKMNGNANDSTPNGHNGTAYNGLTYIQET